MLPYHITDNMYITFDFDGTLQFRDKPRASLFGIIKQLPDCGIKPLVFTTRRDVHIPEVKEFLLEHLGYELPIYNTNFTWKAEYLLSTSFCGLEYNFNGLTKDNYLAHIDDNHDELYYWNKCKIQQRFGARFMLVSKTNKFYNYLRKLGVKL